MFYAYRDVMFEKGILWLNALNVKEKLVLLRRLGRWLEERTRVEREQNLLLDCMSAVERSSDLS
jgi:hypothetical protein